MSISATEKLRIHLYANPAIQQGQPTPENKTISNLLKTMQLGLRESVVAMANLALLLDRHHSDAKHSHAREIVCYRITLKHIAEHGWTHTEPILREWIAAGAEHIPKAAP